MTKRQLIDEIICINKTADPAFLANFSDEELQEYLSHLRRFASPLAPRAARRRAASASPANPSASWATRPAPQPQPLRVDEPDAGQDDTPRVTLASPEDPDEARYGTYVPEPYFEGPLAPEDRPELPPAGDVPTFGGVYFGDPARMAFYQANAVSPPEESGSEETDALPLFLFEDDSPFGQPDALDEA